MIRWSTLVITLVARDTELQVTVNLNLKFLLGILAGSSAETQTGICKTFYANVF